MSKWRLQPAEISAVLKNVSGKAEAMKKDLSKQNFDDLGNALVAGGAGLLGEVPKAVNGLMADQAKNFKLIGDHIQAGLTGVTDATYAYANAQTQMSDDMNRYNQADLFQRSMLDSANSGDMSFFKTHGYDEHGQPLPGNAGS